MESNNLMIWFKSLCNVIVGSDSPNYFALVPNESKTTVLMETADRNNNELDDRSPLANGTLPSDLSVKGAAGDGHDHHHSTAEKVEAKIPNGTLPSQPSSDIENIPQQKESHTALAPMPETTNTEEEDKEELDVKLATCNGHLNNTEGATSAAAAEPCCDIIKYKNLLCQDFRSSPVNNELKSGQTIKSSKLITAIIDVIKSRQLFARFDPFTSKKQQNFPISPLVTVCMRSCTITGFSNIEKTDNDGMIRYLGANRFSIDCPIQILDLRCEAEYCIKLGQKWHKRICLRNKTFTLKLDKCLIYVELKVNTGAKTIRMERFSPISQQNVRCKAQPFGGMNSINSVFCKMLQRYFEKYFATNVLKLESQARRYLDRSLLLKYDDIVADTVLQRLFDCFPTAGSMSSTLSTPLTGSSDNNNNP